MTNDVKKNLLSRDLWLRIMYMIIFYIVSKIVWMLITLIAVVQIVSSLLSGKVIVPVWEFSHGLNRYILKIIDFITFRSEEKPFPFSEWPQGSQHREVSNTHDDEII